MSQVDAGGAAGHGSLTSHDHETGTGWARPRTLHQLQPNLRIAHHGDPDTDEATRMCSVQYTTFRKNPQEQEFAVQTLVVLDTPTGRQLDTVHTYSLKPSKVTSECLIRNILLCLQDRWTIIAVFKLVLIPQADHRHLWC